MKAFLAHGQFTGDDLVDVHFGLSASALERYRSRGLDLRPITIIEGDLVAQIVDLINEAQTAMPGWPRARS